MKVAKEAKTEAKLTKLFGIKEVDGEFQVVTIKADLDKKSIVEMHLDEPMILESARVQFKITVIRNVIEGSLE